jgi:hypothetical protein
MMHTTPPVVVSLAKNEGSSGHGWSFCQSWLKCQRAAWLDEHGEPSAFGELAYPLQLGTILHKLLEFHETEGYRDYILEAPGIATKALEEARAIFGVYRANYPPGHWGKVLGVELPLVSENDIAVAGHPYTGRADMVISVSTKDHIKAWKDAKVPLLMPGLYFVDYKSFTPPFDRDYYANSPQFTGYWEMRASLRKLVRGWKRIRGTLVLGISKTEDRRPPAEGIYIPPPGAEALQIFDSQVQLADSRYRADQLDAECNLTHCGFAAYRCRHYLRDCPLY